MESIDALAKAVNEFEGGLVLVSHDMRLISQVAKEIWICDNKTITRHQGDIQSFKMHMRSQMGIGEEKKVLRGDFSVKQKETTNGEASKPTKAAPAPKLEVIAPRMSTKVEDDDATTTTAATGASAATSNGSPENGRYIPPHLRKKMLETQTSK
jgi:ATP-binding cassette subfamily F protein 2